MRIIMKKRQNKGGRKETNGSITKDTHWVGRRRGKTR